MQLDADQYGSAAFVYEQPTVNIAGKKIALSFSPETQDDEDLIASYLPEAPEDGSPIDPNSLPDKLPGYLIHMTPELVIDDDVVNTASAVTMGTQLHSSLGLWSPSEGWTTSYNKPIAGEYAAIAVDLQGIASEQLDKVKTELETAQTQIEAEDYTNITKHKLTGNMLYSNVLSYFALNNVQDELAARSADIVTYRAPSLGLFRTQLDPLYQWGVAKEVSFPGMVMDIDQVKTVTISKDFDLDKYRAFNQSQGSRYSYMEGFVPEQFFSAEDAPAQAVSAVSALAQASAEGQRILTITSANQAITLPQLTIDQIAKDEIIAGLNAGMTITAHDSPITVGNWQGSGYIILDSETGAGAYKISGGDNGGFITTALGGLSGFLDGLTRFKNHMFNAGNAAAYARASGIITVISAFITVGQILNDSKLSVSQKVAQIAINMASAVAALAVSNSIMASTYLAAANPALLGVFIMTIAISIGLLTLDLMTYDLVSIEGENMYGFRNSIVGIA